MDLNMTMMYIHHYGMPTGITVLFVTLWYRKYNPNSSQNFCELINHNNDFLLNCAPKITLTIIIYI